VKIKNALIASANLHVNTTSLPPDDDTVRKIKIHQLARDLINATVAEHITDEMSAKIAALTLPPLKQQWVRDQVEGIRNSWKQ
jgi:hypothetical protein